MHASHDRVPLRHPRRGLPIVVAVLLGTLSCSVDKSGAPVPEGTLAILPDLTPLVPGASVQLKTVVKTTSGDVDVSNVSTWSTSDAQVASITTQGLLSGVKAGTALLRANAYNMTVERAITVRDGGVATPTGNTVVAANSAVTLAVPPAAVAAPTPIVIEALPGTPSDARVVRGTAYVLGPDVSFMQAAQLVIKYDAAMLGPYTQHAKLQVVRFVGDKWVPVPTSTPIAGTTQVSTNVMELGTYALYAPAPVTQVTVAPTSATVTIGSTTALAVTAKDAAGNVLTDRGVTWASASTAIATVSGSGVVTGVGVGAADVTVTVEGVSATAKITVVAPAPLVAAPTSVSLSATQGSTAAMTQQVLITSPNATAVTSLQAAVAYTGSPTGWLTATLSATTTPATLTLSANPSGLALGAYNATVTMGGSGASSVAVPVTLTIISASPPPPPPPPPAAVATVTVAIANTIPAVGTTTQATATLRDASGNVLTGRAVTWTSNNNSVATVSSSGLVTAVANGNATITATSEGKSGSATLVVGGQVASVSIDFNTVLRPGGTSQAVATLKNGSGQAISGFPITWSSSNTAVATVSATGLITAVSIGAVQITATSQGQSGSNTLAVGTVKTVASVNVSFLGNDPRVEVGKATRVMFDAIGTNGTSIATPMGRFNNGQEIRPVTWNSSNPSVADINIFGQINGLSPGTATITATVDGVVGSATITVGPAPMPAAALGVSLQFGNLQVGTDEQATATLIDSRGGVTTGAVTWSITPTSVATVDANGLIHGVSVGSATVTATSGSISGSAVVNVTAAASAPAAAYTLVQNNGPFISPLFTDVGTQIRLVDGTGNPVPGTVTWFTTAPANATINSSGLATGQVPGSVTIRAISGGRTTSRTFTVNGKPACFQDGPPFFVTPSPQLGVSSSWTVSFNNSSNGVDICAQNYFVYASFDTSIATVDGSGLIRWVGRGTVKIFVGGEFGMFTVP